MDRISIVGLGRLGLPLAVAFASRGFRVVGVDTNPEVLKSIKAFAPMSFEPGLSEMLRENWGRISVTDELWPAVNLTDVTIVIVGTPSDGDGCFSLRYALPVCAEIGKHLREKDGYHLVIVGSTVNPGDCESHLLPKLIEQSGKTVGPDLGFCHVPEYVALGNILKGFLEPDFVHIGTSDMKAASRAAGVYTRLCKNNPPIKRTSLVNAEIAKLAANCHTILKTAFGNQMAELCEQIPGADVDEVTEAIGLDSRASPEFLRGGTYAGGPCLGRDVVSLACVATRAGVELPLVKVTEEVNDWQVERLARIVKHHWDRIQAKRVGILGLTYKPGVNVHEPSAGLLLLDRLARVHPVDVLAYDPAIQVDQSVGTAEVLIELADIVVVTTPWKEFERLKFRAGQVVIDCWRRLDQDTIEEAGARYVAIGRG